MGFLVSVIVATYNSEKTVIDTLESIKNQTYNDLELIVTDDCSSDLTINVVSEWIQKNSSRFDRCVLLKAEVNTGITGNMSRGVEAAKGDYYKVIAGDDLLRNEAISRFAEAVNQDENVIYQCRVLSFYENEDAKVYTKKTNSYDKINEDFLKLKQRNQYYRLLKGNAVHAVGIGLIKVKDYHMVGGVSKKYHWIEDYPLWLKFSEKGYEFRLLDDELIEYRVSMESISHKKPKGYINDEINIFFDYSLKMMLKKGMIMSALYGCIKNITKKLIMR